MALTISALETVAALRKVNARERKVRIDGGSMVEAGCSVKEVPAEQGFEV